MAEAFFYSIAHIQGTGIMLDLFGTDGSYSLPPSEIVERPRFAGCGADRSRTSIAPKRSNGGI